MNSRFCTRPPTCGRISARWLARGTDPYRLAARGILAGIAAFSAVIFAAPLHSTALFFAGAGLIGFGAGLFAIATLTVAMTMSAGGIAGAGIALGAWGAAQPDAERLDLGPRIALLLPVDRATLSLAAEYRARVAGDAHPPSGFALTIAADF